MTARARSAPKSSSSVLPAPNAKPGPKNLAREHGYAIIPPYNDEKIIAGAGTAGLEILADLPDADLVLVPVGGGGLISGIASAFKLSGSQAKVIGVEPELASDAQASFRSGRIVEFSADQTSRTLADGLRTQSVGEINFEHIRRFVDDIVTVSESEILAAIRTLALDAKLVAEPSGAVTFAAFLFRADKLPPGAQDRRRHQRRQHRSRPARARFVGNLLNAGVNLPCC